MLTLENTKSLQRPSPMKQQQDRASCQSHATFGPGNEDVARNISRHKSNILLLEP
jgi:hypothetical protein